MAVDPDTDAQGCRLSTDALAAATRETTSATAITTYAHGDSLWPDRVTEVSRPSVRVPGQFRRESYAYHSVTGALASTIADGWAGEVPTAHDRSRLTAFYADPPCWRCPPNDSLTAAFDPGGPFQSDWLARPQPAYLPKVVDGPRTDAEDVSSMVYFPVDATVPALVRGRLAATRSAAGHITRFEDEEAYSMTSQSR